MNVKQTDSLENILRKKRDLLSDMLLALTKAAQMLEADDALAFDRELDRCGKIMRRVDELSETEKALGASGLGKEEEDLRKEIASIAKKIADMNAELIKASGEKLNSFGSRIKALRQTKQGMGAYSAPANPDAIFIDAKK